jgi:hypothetical protein
MDKDKADKVAKWFRNVYPGRKTAQDAEQAEEAEIEVPCCSDRVHIAYRGVSDERLYIARDRTWYEVRFYKPLGLRVFCAVCRQRVY